MFFVVETPEALEAKLVEAFYATTGSIPIGNSQWLVHPKYRVQALIVP